MTYAFHPWKKNESDRMLSPYMKVYSELSIENGLIKRNSRVVVPRSMQKVVLEVLHTIHMGVEATKKLARSTVWWPEIDTDIALMVKMLLLLRWRNSSLDRPQNLECIACITISSDEESAVLIAQMRKDKYCATLTGIQFYRW